MVAPLCTVQVMLHDVRCQGSERSIGQCKHKGWRSSGCNHYEDASVRCRVPQLQGHKVILATTGKPAFESGRLINETIQVI